MATPVSKADILGWIGERQQRLYQASLRQLTWRSEQLERLRQSVIFRQPERLYDAITQKVDYLVSQLNQSITQIVNQASQRENLLNQRLQARHLTETIDRYQERLSALSRLLFSHMTNAYDMKVSRFDKAQAALLSLDTSRIVARGYAIVQKKETAITSIREVEEGDKLTIQMKDGHMTVAVDKVTIDP